jgi:hypothetical protein
VIVLSLARYFLWCFSFFFSVLLLLTLISLTMCIATTFLVTVMKNKKFLCTFLFK